MGEPTFRTCKVCNQSMIAARSGNAICSKCVEACEGIAYSICDEIVEERVRQDAAFGEQNWNAAYWLTILMEEIGEAAKAIIECKPDAYRAELVQIAAVAINAIGAFDRGHFGAAPWIKHQSEEG